MASRPFDAPAASGARSADRVLGDAIMAEPSCARAVLFSPHSHGKNKLLISHKLENELRMKMSRCVYRNVHIEHDGAGRASSISATCEGRIGAMHVDASEAMDLIDLVKAFIAACE
jgi:hypothetical protein